jgi:peptide/nickel transport system substrate-binding protein
MRRRALLQAAAAAVPTRFAIAQPMRDKTPRFVPQANLSLLDPIFTTAQPTVNHGYAIYDLLFGIDRNLQPKPQMAEGFSLSDDGRTYTIEPRDGLKFHNDEPVRAQDCGPSLARWCARETIGQTVWQYVDEYKATDDKTLVIKLKRPIGIFIEAIARGGASVAFMMPEHMAKTDPFKQIQEHIGSGPYKFLPKEFIAGAAVAYERFKEYVPRQEPAEWSSGGKVAHFERIEWKIVPDSVTAAAALQSGEIDWYEHCQDDLLSVLRKNPDIAFGKANPTGFNGVMRFQHMHPPFNNVKVRQAVMMAVNRDDYMASVTGGDKSLYTTCKSMFPCGSRYDRNLGASAMLGDIG